MAELRIEHVTELPWPPIANTIYVKKGDKLKQVSATGWRLTISPTIGNPLVMAYISYVGNAGEINTNFSSALSAGVLSDIDDDQITTTITSTGALTIGKVFDSAVNISGLVLQSDVNQFDSVLVEWSNDSTNGIDGTWEGQILYDDFTYLSNRTSITGPFGDPIYSSFSISDKDGVGYSHSVDYQDILDATIELVKDRDHIEVYADITARDTAQSNNELNSSQLVRVLDASGDVRVTSGGAVYFYNDDTDTFMNISTDEGGLALQEASW